MLSVKSKVVSMDKLYKKLEVKLNIGIVAVLVNMSKVELIFFYSLGWYVEIVVGAGVFKVVDVKVNMLKVMSLWRLMKL